MKILYVGDEPFFMRSYGMIAEQLLPRLNKEDDIEVACVGLHHQGRPIEVNGVRILPCSNPPEVMVKRVVENWKPDIVMPQGDIGHALMVQNALAQAQTFQKPLLIPIIPIDMPQIRSTKWPEIFIGCDEIITYSDHGKEEIERVSPGSKVHVIPPGLCEEFNWEPKADNPWKAPNKFTVGFVGANCFRKMIGTLYDECAKLPDEIKKDLRILHIGDAIPYHDSKVGGVNVVEKTKQNLLTGKVDIMYEKAHDRGMITRDKMVEAYDAMDCLVLPACNEGFGIPIIEAHARGKPVISTATTTFPKLMLDYDRMMEAVMVPYFDIYYAMPKAGEIANALVDEYEAWKNKQTFERKGWPGWDEIAERYAKVLREAHGGGQ
jgi:glycosyltransferase involved in cell wall biosynthesis